MKNLINSWFKIWTNGNFHDLPITEDFEHISPYGIISGKANYMQLVEINKEKFLNHQFIIHDKLYSSEQACIRYTAVQGSFSLPLR